MASVPIPQLLRDHARTFALTLRLLPRALREPLSIAYLLARASDTVADASGISRERRLGLLEELARALESGEASSWQPEIRSGEISASEKELLAALPDLIAMMESRPDRKELLRLWQTILEGQLFDLQRFRPGVSPLSREELEHYCWLVAGSVGEAWTRLIARCAPGVLPSKRPAMTTMTEWGSGYGKGLQLLNILRDRAEDRMQGRVYLQEKDISEMMKVASGWLDQGRIYCESLAPGRIRYATEIPLKLALRTLERIQTDPEGQKIKMPRWEVAAVLVGSLPSLCFPRRVNPAS